MRHYYAVAHVYGIACDDTGSRIATWHHFSSAAARRSWVADGPSYRSEPGWREAIPSTDAELRRRRLEIINGALGAVSHN